MSASEPLAERRRKSAADRDRSFGIVFACFFTFAGIWPLVVRAEAPRYWALALAVLFAAAALFAPATLAPLNRLWLKLGDLLHRIVSPVVIGLIFCLAVVPVGLLLKLSGKDILRLKRDPSLDSYWILREPPGPPVGSMSKQF